MRPIRGKVPDGIRRHGVRHFAIGDSSYGPNRIRHAQSKTEGIASERKLDDDPIMLPITLIVDLQLLP
jgi:hypothetical protein